MEFKLEVEDPINCNTNSEKNEGQTEEEEEVNEINIPQHCWKEFRGHQINTRPTAVNY